MTSFIISAAKVRRISETNFTQNYTLLIPCKHKKGNPYGLPCIYRYFEKKIKLRYTKIT